MPYSCFVSYSRADRLDAYVQQFVDDLRRELSLAAGVAPEAAVFFDTDSIPMAAEWEPTIRAALCSSKTCVSLCSANYFDSPFCGREYKVFMDRRSEHARRNPGRDSDIIFPLIWIPTEEPIPQSVSQFQYSHATLPVAYQTQGLRHLMKLNKYADEYTEFLAAFVRKIMGAQRLNLPDLPYLPPMSSIEDVFSHIPAANPGERRRGPNRTYFVFCAANNDEMEASGQNADGYGETGWDWAPYGSYVGVLAQDLTTRLVLRYEEMEIGAELLSEMQSAERNKEIVIVILDARTMNIPRYARALERYDEQYFINSAVIVPWNRPDVEGRSAGHELLERLNQHFPRKLVQPPLAHYWQGVSDEDELKKTLEAAVNIVRMNVLALGRVERRAESPELAQQAKREGISVESKPVLGGPSGSPS
jgi:FxsC-like protein